MNKPIPVKDINEFKSKNVINEIIDQYENLLKELFCIRNPEKKNINNYVEDFKSFKKLHLKGKKVTEAGQWFYFPWSKVLIHYLTEDLHNEIRTARNKNLITIKEQKLLYDATIAVAGLSVGSHAALTLAMMGAARHIKLADPDEISASNLNRLNYDFTKVGKNKAETVGQYIYQMNPYSNIEIYSSGVNKENINKFLSKVNILIEEMDNLPMKIEVRLKAKKLNIPVLMATDNGNGVIVDIERYDKDFDYLPFHGRVKILKKSITSDARKVSPKIWNKIASEIIGVEYMEEDLITSLAQIGQTISGVPQLGLAAIMSGSLLALCVSRIITKKKLNSGKYIFSVDSIFDPDYTNLAKYQGREKTREEFRKFLNL